MSLTIERTCRVWSRLFYCTMFLRFLLRHYSLYSVWAFELSRPTTAQAHSDTKISGVFYFLGQIVNIVLFMSEVYK
jgi:hypothetical protein